MCGINGDDQGVSQGRSGDSTVQGEVVDLQHGTREDGGSHSRIKDCYHKVQIFAFGNPFMIIIYLYNIVFILYIFPTLQVKSKPCEKRAKMNVHLFSFMYICILYRHSIVCQIVLHKNI